MRLVSNVSHETPRRSARVKTVAKDYFDSDQTQVRRLIDAGELETYTIGKRGVRVFLDSVAAYQQRKTKSAKPIKGVPTRQQISRASRAARNEAIAALNKWGR
jgi:hypothetical protein